MHPLSTPSSSSSMPQLWADWMFERATQLKNASSPARILVLNNCGNDLQDGFLQNAIDADVLLLSMGQFMTLARDNYNFKQPVIIREPGTQAAELKDDTMDTSGREAMELFKEHLEHLEKEVKDPRLEVQNPSRMTLVPKKDEPSKMESQRAVEKLKKSEVMDMLNRGLSFNCLSLPDYSHKPRPEFLKIPRFKLLHTLSEKLSHQKKAEIDKSLSFGLFARPGIVSGMHVDKLNGTWIQIVVGYKAWSFLVLRKEDIDAFAQLGHNWVPPKGELKWLELIPKDYFIMPPGVLVAHAPYTKTDCAIRGGMYWDALCIVPTLENILQMTIQNNDTTNEDIPLFLPSLLDKLLACDEVELPRGKNCGVHIQELVNKIKKSL